MADLATKEMRKRIFKISAIVALIIAVLAGGLLWWFFSAHISLVAVRGESMEPTLKDGQTIILSQAYQVEKDMLVVFKKPDNWPYMGEESPELIKRIAAGGGSTIKYDGTILYVDDLEVYNLEEDNYSCDLEPGYEYTLTKEELFVMGDNHKKSLDSLRILCDAENTKAAYVPFLETFAYGHLDGTL